MTNEIERARDAGAAVASASADAGANARIEALEVKLAYVESALQELSDALYRQQQLIEAMEGRYQRLLDRVESAERGTDPPAGFEVPPHY